MNSNSARCGHIKRRLLRSEPLTGDLLELALGLIGNPKPEARGDFGVMAAKFRAGQPLDSYELHLMIDMVLLHARLAGRRSCSLPTKAELDPQC